MKNRPLAYSEWQQVFSEAAMRQGKADESGLHGIVTNDWSRAGHRACCETMVANVAGPASIGAVTRPGAAERHICLDP